jgi:hypothetical protein
LNVFYPFQLTLDSLCHVRLAIRVWVSRKAAADAMAMDTPGRMNASTVKVVISKVFIEWSPRKFELSITIIAVPADCIPTDTVPTN